VRVEEVQEAIPDGASLIEFLRYRRYQGKCEWQDSYGALLLSGCAQPKWVSLGAADAIDRKPEAVSTPDAQRGWCRCAEFVCCTRSIDNSGRLWPRPLPADTKQVIISPDSQLNFLSFATLLTSFASVPRRRVCDQFTSPSGRDLLLGRAPTRRSRNQNGPRIRDPAARWTFPTHPEFGRALRLSEPTVRWAPSRSFSFGPIPTSAPS